MKLITPWRFASLLVAAVVVTSILLVVNHHQPNPNAVHNMTVKPSARGPSASASIAPNTLKPSLGPYVDKYPALTTRVMQFVQIRYSRPTGQTSDELKNALRVSGLTTQNYLDNFALVTPPANATLDAQHINVISSVTPGTVGGEFSDPTIRNRVVENYTVSTFQEVSGIQQYPATSLESSVWLLIKGQWYVDSTSS